MDELTIGDKIYISSKKAATVTGYAKDYVGQLCREGRVEATLVGRSWYVLESSIHEHRFGKEEENSAESTLKSDNALEAWGSATYRSENVASIPELAPRQASVAISEPPAPSQISNAYTDGHSDSEAENVANMQSVWREWFDKRSKEPVGESEVKVPEDAVELVESDVSREDEQELEAPEEKVQIKRSHMSYTSPRAYAQDIVPIRNVHQQQERAQEIEEHIQLPKRAKKRDRTESTGGGMVVRALIIALTILVVSISLIGTGVSRNFYNDKSPLAGFLDYLGGTRILNK
jgi:hypothetical protein